MWANISNDLDDPTLKDAGPKAMDHLRSITEQLILPEQMHKEYGGVKQGGQQKFYCQQGPRQQK